MASRGRPPIEKEERRDGFVGANVSLNLKTWADNQPEGVSNLINSLLLKEKEIRQSAPTHPLTPEFLRYRLERAAQGYYLYLDHWRDDRSRYYELDFQGILEIFVGVGVVPPGRIEDPDSELKTCRTGAYGEDITKMQSFEAIRSAVPEYTVRGEHGDGTYWYRSEALER